VAAGAPAPLAVALAAGALLAVNPLAHWFSQEARSYALFILLSATAWVVLLSAAERATPRRLWVWGLVAAAAAWTHYFGGLLFVVGWATLALVAVAGARGGRLRALRPLALPAVVSGVAVAALAPIARNQQSTDMYQAISQVKGLPARIVELPKQFAVGYNAPAEYVVGAVLMVVLVVLVLAAAWPRDGRPTRATALLGLVAVVWVLPLLALAGGFDVVLTRNFVLLVPPLTVLAALGAWRLGRRAWIALGAVAVVQVATIVIVALTPVYQREDWRGLIRAATDGIARPEAVFIGAYQEPAATYYAPTLRPLPATPLVVRSVALVDRLDPGKAMTRIPVPPPPPGFTLAHAEQRDQWHVFVWTAPVPTAVDPALVAAWQTTPPRTSLLRP
ncbi:hypothetical protein AB0L40_15005, partial [Patulibacter sp. NPDC049589]|uniref:hypothetical protein n=1 Tax=Patulibacter sp. NPDC049589 TaxID=3154731 RepID=UPI00343262F4